MAHSLLNPTVSSSVVAYRHLRIGDEVHGFSSLFIEFKAGIYRYIVPYNICDDMDQAASKGQYVNTMKTTHHGIPMSFDAVTEMIRGALQVTAHLKPKLRVFDEWYILKYPQLNYFF